MFKAIIFDLYGTLLHFNQRALIKELASFLNTSPRPISTILLKNYLCKNTEDKYTIINDLLQLLSTELISENTAEKCLEIFEKHLSTITLKDKALGILSFLKARGYKLGLISNLVTSFKAPFYTYNLDKYFNSIVFSCDQGIKKPQEDIYKLACHELNVKPEECLFIGDSFLNDYQQPKNLGMEAILISSLLRPTVTSIKELSDLAWLNLTVPFNSLIFVGENFTLKGQTYHLSQFKSLSDKEQGRYNLLAKATLKNYKNLSESQSVYIKRFASPGSASVEKLAYEIYSLADLSEVHVQIINTTSDEPFLLTTEVEGEKWDEKYISEIAFDVGQYGAIAYIFAYADYRPHNSIIQKKDGALKMQMIDLEHCFFNIALDLTDLADTDNPRTFNEMPRELIEKRRKRMSLSPNHMRRCRRAFIPTFTSQKMFLAYKEGWIQAYHKVQALHRPIEELLKSSINTSPYPMIGTHSYRRAMANIDIEEIIMRLKENPLKSYEWTLEKENSAARVL